MSGHNEISCLAIPANLGKLLTFLDDSCKQAGLAENVAFAVKLAGEEACTNIINHAYREAGPGNFAVEYSGDQNSRISANFNGMRVLLVTDNPFNQQLAVELINAQWGKTGRLAHTRKGLVGTPGAKNVAIAAGTLETDSKSRQADAAEAALSALTSLFTALQKHFTDKPAAAVSAAVSGDVQPDKLPNCLPPLRQLLGEGDSDAIDLLEKTTRDLSKRCRRNSCTASARPCKILNSMPHKSCRLDSIQNYQPLRPRNPN